MDWQTNGLAGAEFAQVQAGRLDEGMVLEEAMALVCGPADDAGNSASAAT